MAAIGPEAAQMPFIKNLASSDRKLRTQSLTTLQSFLSTKPNLSLPEALKLWTGLYYALWMTDRPRPQQALATELASLSFSLPPSSQAPFLIAFWQILSKQWTHIDALRMDKFLLLVRRVFAAHVRCARESRWTGSQVDKLLEILEHECFDAQERGDVALGLRLHVLDLWVDEMEREHALGDKAGQDLEREMQASRGDFVRRVGDVVETLRRSPVRSVRARAEESFADPRLPWAVLQGEEGEEEEAENDEEDGWGGIED
ncbi:hypothetical protein E4U30_005479 [Claviceps sp. LM220 group G6]|nr:hypothetical protein E4U30_005479 [Claviceps sp. LM220 group G6]KAG6105688.1 hypothetical protein E4U31_001285 [Claviceps sp. LM219 group G6]KAG6121270.1 hypothetical protein E4U14_002181 [Claviceps sp. LM454 group G7]